MHSFEIYGKWSVQTTNKQASINTHTHAQCSHTSVGPAQAPSDGAAHSLCGDVFFSL